MKRNHWQNYVSRSGSRFESKQAFINKSALVNSTDDMLETAGVPMSLMGKNLFACTDKEFHTFIIGESGCGKTRRTIYTTVSLMAKTGESMVIADPKGEIYRNTSNMLKNKGYNVKVINFRTPSRGNRWNPLALIEEYYRSSDEQKQDKALIMLKDIFTILKEEVKSKDVYWENSASDFMLGVAQVILEYAPKGSLTFENISIVAKDIFENRKNNNFISYFDDMPKNLPIRKNLTSVIDNADTTAACIYNVFQSMLSPFTSQQSILRLFNASDFEIGEIGRQKTALYIVLPDDSPAFYSVATVFVNQIYTTLVDFADTQARGELPNRVMFLLDEFANFTQIPSIDSMLTAARSRGMRFVLVCQSMEQLNKKYGHDGTEILLSNCRTWIYMSCRNYEFLKRLENLCGTYISPYTKQVHPLISISDLQHFEMGKILVLNDRCYPFIGYLPDYSQVDFGEEAFILADFPEERTYDDRVILKLTNILRNKPLAEKRAEAAEKGNETSAGVDVEGDDLFRKIKEIIKKPGTSDTEATDSEDSWDEW